MHKDIFSHCTGDLPAVYSLLDRDQNQSASWRTFWQVLLLISLFLLTVAPTMRWESLAVAIFAAYRAIWHGIEMSNRNQLMHLLNMEQWSPTRRE